MVTRKEEKNTSSSLLAGPPGGSPAGPAAASPSPTPSQLRPAAGPDRPGTDLGPQASPTPGGQGQGRGLPGCTHPAAPSPGIRWQSFGPGWGRRCSQPLALPYLPGPPWPAPCPLGPGRRVRGRCPPGPYSPLADMAQQPEPRQGARRRDPAGRGEGAAPNAHPRAHAPARGEAARSVGTPPGCRTPGRAGRSGHGDPPRGAATLTAGGQPWAGPGARPPRRPASPPGPVAAGDARAALLRRRAGLLSPRAWSVQSGSTSPPQSPGFLM